MKDVCLCAGTVIFWSQLQERTACQGEHLGDVIFEQVRRLYLVTFTADVASHFVFPIFNPVHQNVYLRTEFVKKMCDPKELVNH